MTAEVIGGLARPETRTEEGEMATKVRIRSTCRYCHQPIGLSHWSGWVDLTANGSHDMCPGTVSAAHEPTQ